MKVFIPQGNFSKNNHQKVVCLIGTDNHKVNVTKSNFEPFQQCRTFFPEINRCMFGHFRISTLQGWTGKLFFSNLNKSKLISEDIFELYMISSLK